MLHRRTHPIPVDGCYACKLTTFTVAPSATPSRHPQAVEVNAREDRWSSDMDAYKRLRSDGVQPRSIDGARKLELHAETEAEVTAGNVLDDRQRRQLAAATEMIGEASA